MLMLKTVTTEQLIASLEIE